jgi:tRNA A-37 threonylcarbamoyl transferase component Bud32
VGKSRFVQQITDVLADRYELGPVLGEGGMARVHRGLDRQLRRHVAVKVLAPPLDRDRSFIERFRREARAAAGLSHPNIVAVFDSGSDHGTHFIVTELVEGETLADRLKRDGPMPPAEAVAVAVDVARALAAAHERGLIHRDIKPGNVMVLPDGRVKVVDFGIARAAGSDTLTGTGVVLGSTAYLSPEQAGGKTVDERADLYALGCVVYEMLTGHVPFRADTPIATMYRHVNEDAPPPSTITPVQPELEAVVMRCLEKEPKRRFASAAELEAALLAVPLVRSGDTMQLEPVDAAETQPVAAVVGAAETQPVATVVGGGAPRQLTGTPTSSHARRKPRSHRTWLAAALVVALLLTVAGVLLAVTSDPFRPRAQARAAAEEAAANSPSIDPSSIPPDTSMSFADAWAGLISAIGSAQLTEEISDHAADELTKRANELLDAYRQGDAEEIGDKLGDLEEELGKAIDDEEISSAAADTIDQAISDVVVALGGESALEVVSPSPDEESSSGEDGDQGPPGHAEANGHEED